MLWKQKKVPTFSSLFEQKPLENDEYLWAYEIMQFFQIPQTYDKEKAAAIKIEEFLVRCKQTLLKQRF